MKCSVTADGIYIGNRIYWACATRKYNKLLNLFLALYSPRASAAATLELQ
jgi:hypothetical protein